ncbi:hypothetical protein QSJ19_19720 [Gordonia sp. ABSL11-1]|uniref:hypothetical protein n=1 Tax=Gordonia sp. ABSL11-1 TaxID=3053924 RepID=UPI00257476E9|nr:hypothetical protein [Gordonia sp. ABSL11-1]MDL9947766.1 hypothetical protein [Gordonia sp. ABSL11-1]
MSSDAEPPISSLPLSEQPDAIWRQVQANERAAARLFWPSPIIERLLWQVCGAWETVIEEVRFFRYVIEENPPTEPPFVYPDGDNVARDLRRIARWLNIRLPSETEWTAECKRAKAMRDDLGHMLHFTSISGETPNQSVTIRRVPYREPDEMRIDSGWAMHNRKTVTITEAEAGEVLAGLKYVNDSIFALRKFGMEFSTDPDNDGIRDVLGILPWWLDDWGPRPGEEGWTVPTMRQLRVLPQHDYIETLPESQRPQP